MSSNPASTAVADDVVADADAAVAGADPAPSMPVSAVDPVAPPGPRPAVVVVIDQVALDLARSAAVAESGAPDHIGDFLVAVAEDEVAITATFRADQPGYLGWQWSVTLAVLEDQHPTVSEVVLLPGDGALVAPAWIPWDQRIRPGDLGVGDLLPPVLDDPRIVPAYLQSDDPAVEAVATEAGLGRVRVMSREGRVDFAERLHEGSFGPDGEMALAAPAHCVTCAFYLPLAGSLGQLLGACGNDLSPADAHVVDAGYGCGAHSETVLVMPARSAATDSVIDELALEVHRRPAHRSARSAIDPDAAVDSSDVAFDVDLGVDLDLAGAALDEWTDPYVVGAMLAEAELVEAALLDSDPAEAIAEGESTDLQPGQD